MKNDPATPAARRKVDDERWLRHLKNPGRPDRFNSDRDESLLNAAKGGRRGSGNVASEDDDINLDELDDNE